MFLYFPSFSTLTYTSVVFSNSKLAIVCWIPTLKIDFFIVIISDNEAIITIIRSHSCNGRSRSNDGGHRTFHDDDDDGGGDR